MTDEQPRRWVNVYVQFSLPTEDLDTLDALLVARGSSLGLEFRRALRATLVEAGIDPAGLERPESEVDADDHAEHHAPARPAGIDPAGLDRPAGEVDADDHAPAQS